MRSGWQPTCSAGETRVARPPWTPPPLCCMLQAPPETRRRASCRRLLRPQERCGMGFDPNAQNNYPNNPGYQGSPFQQNRQGYQQYPGYPGAPAVSYTPGALPRAIDVGVVMRQVYLWLAFGLAVAFGLSFALG